MPLPTIPDAGFAAAAAALREQLLGLDRSLEAREPVQAASARREDHRDGDGPRRDLRPDHRSGGGRPLRRALVSVRKWHRSSMQSSSWRTLRRAQI